MHTYFKTTSGLSTPFLDEKKSTKGNEDSCDIISTLPFSLSLTSTPNTSSVKSLILQFLKSILSSNFLSWDRVSTSFS